MALRNIKIDNSVKYVSKDDHPHKEPAPPIPKREIVSQIQEGRMLLKIINFHRKIQNSLKI